MGGARISAGTALNLFKFPPTSICGRYRDPQLQAGENYSPLFILDHTFAKLDLKTHISFPITVI